MLNRLPASCWVSVKAPAPGLAPGDINEAWPIPDFVFPLRPDLTFTGLISRSNVHVSWRRIHWCLGWKDQWSNQDNIVCASTPMSFETADSIWYHLGRVCPRQCNLSTWRIPEALIFYHAQRIYTCVHLTPGCAAAKMEYIVLMAKAFENPSIWSSSSALSLGILTF